MLELKAKGLTRVELNVLTDGREPVIQFAVHDTISARIFYMNKAQLTVLINTVKNMMSEME